MIEERLKKLGIILPVPPNPAGSYVPIVVSGNLVFVSGQIPIEDGHLKYQGKVGKEKLASHSIEKFYKSNLRWRNS